MDVATDECAGDNIITCSEDGTLRMFNSVTKRQTMMIDLTVDNKKEKIPLDYTKAK
jgi:hypothetical protein